jgi:pterin-4a-carbinolamine dehydratase
MNQEWQERVRPLRLEKRYEFSSYDELRDFLDQAADLSEREGLYPDMGFGRNYVNMTIHADEGCDEIKPNQHEFAKQLEVLKNNGRLKQA